jgi:3-methyladenine DNA glycosylase AlkD
VKNYIEKRLFELQDTAYRDFHSRLIPTISPDRIIGVRTPALRKLAKELIKDPYIAEFLQDLPHSYYDENTLHALLISELKDYALCLQELDRFLPYVDNWATCDIMSPKIFKKHLPELIPVVESWIRSSHPYTIRFGLVMLMSFYLDEAFRPEYLTLAASAVSEEYYVKMAVAWYFATALAKQYEATIPYIEQQKLPKWTHNKAIQKAIESYRITADQKAYLRTLKLSGGITEVR